MAKYSLDSDQTTPSEPPDSSRLCPRDVEWTWDKSLTNDYIDLLNDGRDVKFHRNFSNGTAVVRGTKPMLHDQHFWAVEMISPVYGTDMMIGVGTPEADVKQMHDRFISYLGMNNQTWGLSYTGFFHHNGESRGYSPRFGQGSIIGVHLDMWNGTLSYYKNKRHLGIASRGLKGKTLYAMASSTAACSGMRIVSSSSFPSSLQFLCCARLRELIPDDKSVIRELTFPPGLRLFLENNLSWLLDRRSTEVMGHIYIPVPKRRRWIYESDCGNASMFPMNPMFQGVFYQQNLEEESENEMDVDNTKGFGNVFILRNRPVLWCNCNRFQQRLPSTSRENHRNCATGHDDHGEEPKVMVKESNSYTSGEQSATEELDKSLGLSSSFEDSEESETKRRRCSYNYLMGLSDPDSD